MRQNLKNPVSSDIFFSCGKNKWTFTIQSIQGKGSSCMFTFSSLHYLVLCGSNWCKFSNKWVSWKILVLLVWNCLKFLVLTWTQDSKRDDPLERQQDRRAEDLWDRFISSSILWLVHTPKYWWMTKDMGHRMGNLWAKHW